VDAQQAVTKCPICGVGFDPEADRRNRPFCSERCRLVDLSRWLRGEYVIPGRSALDPEVLGDLGIDPSDLDPDLG